MSGQKSEFEGAVRTRRCLRCGTEIQGRGYYCEECVGAIEMIRWLRANPNTCPLPDLVLEGICAREGRERGGFVPEPVGWREELS